MPPSGEGGSWVRRWIRRFVELKNFKAEHGHCNVPHNFKDSPTLRRWVEKQRMCYRNLMANNGKETRGMNRKRIKMLEEIGFCWSAEDLARLDRAKTSRNIWTAHYESLKNYKAQHGHCNVPLRCEDYPQLGHWIRNQRRYYKNFIKGDGEDTGSLNQERIKMLEEIGFCWTVRQLYCLAKAKSCSDNWMTHYESLKSFKAEHGHCNVPISNPALGDWVRKQRHFRKNFIENNGKQTSGMNKERIQMLEEIGFCWSGDHLARLKRAKRFKDYWMVQFAALEVYKAKHGHCNVPQNFKANPKLAHWVKNQRHFYKKFVEGDGEKTGSLNEERFKMLEEIGFCGAVGQLSRNKREKASGDSWMAHYESLKNYKAKHGHCNVPKKFNPRLAAWVSQQRHCHKKFLENNGKQTSGMNKERIKMLEEIGFCWSPGNSRKKRAVAELEFEDELVESLDLSDLVASGSGPSSRCQGREPDDRLAKRLKTEQENAGA